ncbi:threonine ammonia-lyase, biosynthetic [Modicisalibacter tunisiensis]|uniref:L-threonine dehydratase n=2 Tax=Modicisalibacter tunisiensis TaxID=390637 RepID=A0ABS7WWX6_9GAMM|nr:threonine ammonia-lyase, biosynthetic [Modicisalibacter tunisiensis]
MALVGGWRRHYRRAGGGCGWHGRRCQLDEFPFSLLPIDVHHSGCKAHATRDSQETRMLEDTVKKILQARVYEAARETPLSPAPFLSRRLDNQILIKREDLQPVFSFKVRGAYNKMALLSDAQKAKGVIAASAGNHAQGLALAARQLGVKAVIVMPRITPEIKVQAVRARGAKVVLKGDAFSEAQEHAQTLIAEHGYTYIPPFDDIDVIAGQGTVGMEILRQNAGRLDAIFVPVGGGGLIAGIAAYVKYLRPEVKVIGVESEDSACLKAALEAGERVVLDQVGVFAEGVAVAQIGEAPFAILRGLVDEVITVNTDEMCAAVKDIFEDTRAVSETSGALSLAGLKKYIQQTGASGETLVCINSGANTNFDRLQHIAERTELGEQREAILAVTIPERPGSFKKFCRIIGKRMVTEFNYRYADLEHAHIFVGVQVKPGGDDRAEVIRKLRDAGYPVEDLTDNELAKLHIRHLGGGRPKEHFEEEVYRFEFPERPGALMNFLTHLPADWNISLFHYRNHGAAYGRVLVGMQVPNGDRAHVEEYFERIGYRFWKETDNVAYRLFME